jgi:site-specific recombinase XerC
LRLPIEAFLDELRTGRRLSPRTVDAYAHDLADYLAFAAHTGSRAGRKQRRCSWMATSRT